MIRPNGATTTEKNQHKNEKNVVIHTSLYPNKYFYVIQYIPTILIFMKHEYTIIHQLLVPFLLAEQLGLDVGIAHYPH